MGEEKKKTIEYKRWFVRTVSIVVILVLCVLIVNIVVDPYFHYHKPYFNYRLSEERYINDGIARNFDYDAMIIGNSLSQNFKTSLYDDRFGVKSVKLPYSGAGVKELWTAIGKAIGRNSLDEKSKEYVISLEPQMLNDYKSEKGYKDNVKEVLVCVDIEDMMRNFSWHRYNDYPDYLYDEEVLNDINYLLNKETLYRGTIYNIGMTLRGIESTTFDEYSSWNHDTGAEEACEDLSYIDPQSIEETICFDEDEKIRTSYNLECNVFPVTDANTDVIFRMVIPPVSIAKWAQYYEAGELEYRLEDMEYIVGRMLEKNNIIIYCFADEYQLVTDLDQYCDAIHYSAQVNDWMIEEMAGNRHVITEENFKESFEQMRIFYTEYDYAQLNKYIVE